MKSGGKLYNMGIDHFATMVDLKYSGESNTLSLISFSLQLFMWLKNNVPCSPECCWLCCIILRVTEVCHFVLCSVHTDIQHHGQGFVGLWNHLVFPSFTFIISEVKSPIELCYLWSFVASAWCYVVGFLYHCLGGNVKISIPCFYSCLIQKQTKQRFCLHFWRME